MKNSAIILATLFASNEAREVRLSSDYQQFVVKFGKGTTSIREAITRQRNFQHSQDIIDEINAEQAINGGAKAGHNQLSDLDDEEKAQMLGLKSSTGRGASSLPLVDDENNNLGNSMNIDHVKKGVMSPVKTQGQCGSCYAQGALLTLEGALAIKNGTDPLPLSVQEQVDCSNRASQSIFGKNYGNLGCNGGLPEFTWKFGEDNGHMKESDYNYTGRDEQCKRTKNDDRVVVKPGTVRGWKDETSVAGMVETLQTTPISIGVHASCNAFMYYESGIITAQQCPPYQMDHAVVIVAYASGEADDDAASDDDSESEQSEDEESEDSEDSEDDDSQPANKCKVTKWWYNCDKQMKANNRKADGERYFRIQNSWGTRWGEGGFARMEAVEGAGPANMNSWAQSPILA